MLFSSPNFRVGTSLGLVLALVSPKAFAASVASSSPYSTQAAQKILRQGGNAVDAACAAVFVQGVTQSYFTGIGSGGYALLRQASESSFYDFREQAPASTTGKLFSAINPKSKTAWREQNTGPLSVGIPGSVAGCGLMQKKHGKLAWKQILQPAIALARDGFTVSQMYSEELGDNWKRLAPFELTVSTYKGKEGSGVKKGETIRQPLLAKTLETLAEQGPDSFYRGELAQGWLQEARTLGVRITTADLAGYKVNEHSPVQFKFGARSGLTAAAPAGAGYTVASVLGFLDHFQNKYGVPEAASLTRYVTEIEAFDHFGSLRNRAIADTDASRTSTKKYLGSPAEKKAWGTIEKRIVARLKKAGVSLTPRKSAKSVAATELAPVSKAGPIGQTSHTSNISVVDDDGGQIALTSSVGNIFGSGITVPKYGFLLNSTLGDFDLKPGQTNSPAAARRPRSNMSPTFLFAGDEPIAVLGAAGGPLIPMAVVQFAQNYYVYGMDAQTAVRFPRVSASGGSVELEKSAGEALLAQLKKAGYEIEATDTIWAVLNAVVRKDAKSPWEAVSESRYDGEAWTGALK